MTEIIETIKKNLKTHKDIKLIVNKDSNDSCKNQLRIDQTAFIQRRYFEEGTVILAETTGKMDNEIELKDDTVNYVNCETGISQEEIIKPTYKVEFKCNFA